MASSRSSPTRASDYRDDLRARSRARASSHPGESASHLILAAYRAWGADCASHLEGDFAFVIWDGACEARRRRPRFLGEAHAVFMRRSEGRLEPRARVDRRRRARAPRCERVAQPRGDRRDGGGDVGRERRDVLRIRARAPGRADAHARSGAGYRLHQHWSPPRASTRDAPPFEEAAIELRKLLTRAVTERLDGEGDTSIWLSGGWDSPAVFAAGASALDSGNRTHKLRPVSISYPEGDPGREDELIREIAARWNAAVHWLDIQNIPFFDQPAERAATRDEPFAHPFEMWHRSLARGTRATHSRVALEGVGGDQLFQVSEVFLADLLRTGRLAELAREWKAKGMSGSGFRTFFRWAIQPNLPRPALAARARACAAERPLVGYLERALPPWIDAALRSRRTRSTARDRLYAPRVTHRNRCRSRNSLVSVAPVFPSRVRRDVDVCTRRRRRDPLSAVRQAHHRVRAHAPARGAFVRARRRRNCCAHRCAGLLPDSILAPRAKRTGETGGYFTRSMRQHLPALVDTLFDQSLSKTLA